MTRSYSTCASVAVSAVRVAGELQSGNLGGRIASYAARRVELPHEHAIEVMAGDELDAYLPALDCRAVPASHRLDDLRPLVRRAVAANIMSRVGGPAQTRRSRGENPSGLIEGTRLRGRSIPLPRP